MLTGRVVKLAVTGTAAGLFSGLFGVGGGTVMVPLLVLWLGYGDRRATGTSLAAIVVIAVMATLLQGAYGNVSVSKGLLVGVPAVLWSVDRDLGAAAGTDRDDRAAVRDADDRGGSRPGADVILAAAMGLAAGIVAGMLGVGGGILFVPALTLVLSLSQVRAEATSLLAIIPVALVGAYRQHRYGNVDLREGAVVGALAAVGVACGVVLSNVLPERALKLGFAALMVFAAAQLLRRFWRTRTMAAEDE